VLQERDSSTDPAVQVVALATQPESSTVVEETLPGQLTVVVVFLVPV
jgi:hypothetical protein